jgi:hypothetical protein
MAVSKRLRFEILRRDNHTCRYCGAAAPAVKLTVDHVVPEVLGGKDEPSNLVTACEPCNSGKTSLSPDAGIVEDIKQDALRWARAMDAARRIHREQREARLAFCDGFIELWDRWHVGPEGSGEKVPLDSDWESTLVRFYEHGLDLEDIRHAVAVAMGNNTVPLARTFRYFAGVCWRLVGELQNMASAIVETES